MAFKRLYEEPKVVVGMPMDLLQGLANFRPEAQAELNARLLAGGINMNHAINHYIDWLTYKVVYWQ